MLESRNREAGLQKKHLKQPSQQSADWHHILSMLLLSGMAAELARHCVLSQVDKENIHLVLDPSGEQLHTATTEETLRQALGEYFHNPKLNLILSTGVVQQETPAKRKERQIQELQQKAEDEIQQDPFVKQLQERFDARIIPGSIKPTG